jgi:hypothetical protein
MVELGIKVPGCKGTFTPIGNEVGCSPACRDKLERYNNQISAKKNFPKHREKINAREVAKYTRRRKALQHTCQGPLDPKTTGGPRCGEIVPYKKHSPMLYCSDRCEANFRNEVRRQWYQSNASSHNEVRRQNYQPRPAKKKTCEAPHPTIPGALCGKPFEVTGGHKGGGSRRFCSDDCNKRFRRSKGW